MRQCCRVIDQLGTMPDHIQVSPLPGLSVGLKAGHIGNPPRVPMQHDERGHRRRARARDRAGSPLRCASSASDCCSRRYPLKLGDVRLQARLGARTGAPGCGRAGESPRRRARGGTATCPTRLRKKRELGGRSSILDPCSSSFPYVCELRGETLCSSGARKVQKKMQGPDQDLRRNK